MKLFKSFCKKELIARRITLRNQKIGFSEKDLMIFKTCLLVLKLSLIVHEKKKIEGEVFFKFLEYQKATKKRIQLIGNMLKISSKTQNLEKFSVLRELKDFVGKCRKGNSLKNLFFNLTEQLISENKGIFMGSILNDVFSRKKEKVIIKLKLRYLKLPKMLQKFLWKTNYYQSMAVIKRFKILIPKYRIRQSQKLIRKLTGKKNISIPSPKNVSDDSKFIENFLLRKKIFNKCLIRRTILKNGLINGFFKSIINNIREDMRFCLDKLSRIAYNNFYIFNNKIKT
jgi:hypothetical protein